MPFRGVDGFGASSPGCDRQAWCGGEAGKCFLQWHGWPGSRGVWYRAEGLGVADEGGEVGGERGGVDAEEAATTTGTVGKPLPRLRVGQAAGVDSMAEQQDVDVVEAGPVEVVSEVAGRGPDGEERPERHGRGGDRPPRIVHDERADQKAFCILAP